MRKFTFISLLCLWLASCTIGITKRVDVAPNDDVLVETRVAATVAALKLATPTSTATMTPTSTPPPTPTRPVILRTATAPPVSRPVIQSFFANPTEPNPGDPIYLSWTSTGGVRASLRQWLSAQGTEGVWRDVSLNGYLVIDTQTTDRHWQDFELTVFNNAGASTSATISIRFRCAYTFFFSTNSRLCPDRPAQSTQAAEQVFEGGRMIWLEHAAPLRQWGWSAEGKDDFVILVFYTQGYSGPAWQMFVDAWREGEPDSDPNIVPPQGMYQPVRGFGKAWRAHPEVRQRLGWALGQEKGFSATYQQVSGLNSNDVCTYLVISDGRVISMCRKSGFWSFGAP
jgi:hypothetical protein